MRNLGRFFLAYCAASCLHCQNVQETPEASGQEEPSATSSTPDSEVARRIAQLQKQLEQEIQALELQQKPVQKESSSEPPPGSLAFLHLYEASTRWMRELDMQHFDGMVGTGRSIVYIGATWCGPCVPQSKILGEVSVEVGAQVNIAKITSGKNPDEQSLLARLKVNPLELRLPTLIFLSDGRPVGTVDGLTSKKDILSYVR